MWRNNQREAHRTTNGRPASEGRRPDGNYISVAKHASGKKAPYMVWLQKFGRRRFVNTHKMPYDQNNSEHKSIMSAWHTEFKNDPEWSEERRKIQEECEAHNNDRHLVSQTKHAQLRRNREQRHRMPDLYESKRTEHVKAQEEARKASSVHVAGEVPNVFMVQDLDPYLRNSKETSRNNLTSFFRVDRNTTRNPFCTDEFMIQLITVIPFNYILKKPAIEISCYPAEICLTTFNLNRGIVRNTSRLVKMDAEWYYGGEYVSDDKRYQYRDHSGIDEHHPFDGAEDAFDVFRWLEEEMNRFPHAKILCDQSQHNFAYYGLKTMAEYTGLNAKHFFKDRIITRLMGIQDFTSNLIGVTCQRGQSTWNDEAISHEFSNYQLIPRSDQNFYCDFHEECRMQTKLACAKAHNAKLIHSFFRVLRKNRMYGFDFNGPLHDICSRDDNPILPMTLTSPVFTPRQVYGDQHENQNDNHQDGNQQNGNYPDGNQQNGNRQNEDHGRQDWNDQHYNDNDDTEDDNESDDDGDPDEYFYGRLANTNSQHIASSSYTPRRPGAASRDLHSPSRDEPVNYPRNDNSQRYRQSPPREVPREAPAPVVRPKSPTGIPLRENWEAPYIYTSTAAERYVETAKELFRKPLKEYTRWNLLA